jgi:hypothetical protein
MKKLINKAKFILFMPGIFVSMSCSGGEYTFESGNKLCVSSEVVEAKKSSTSNKYRRLLVKLENMPTDVSVSYVKDLSVSRSLLLAIEEPDNTKYKFDHYEKIFSSALTSGGLSHDKEFGLYRLDRESESAIQGYDYLKIDPRSEGLNEQPQKLQDWYLGLCVEGIGDRSDTCKILYPFNGFILKFEVIREGLSEWETILNRVNENVSGWSCALSVNAKKNL